MACCAVALLSYANYVGIRQGTAIQSFFTVAKLAAMAALVVAGLLFGRHSSGSFWQGESIVSRPSLLGAISVAMIAVLWAYDGWNNLTFVAGEVRKPARDLPLSLILGTAIVMLVYLLMNAVYLYAVPAVEMQGVARIAELAMNRLLGPASGAFVAIAVVLSTLGSINAMLLASARLYYAMARDGLFFQSVGRVHARHATPGVSLIVQALVTCALTLTGSYEQLITYVMLAQMLFFIATALSVFILRRRMPDLKRPYKTWGYPVVPVLYILTLMVIAVNTVLERPMESLYGLGLVLLGLPAYWFWRRRTPR
jgi:APA family basic amino acid/polyamine antiporter